MIQNDDSGRERARRVVQLRMQDRGMTNADLAAAAGVNVDTVSDFLNGHGWPRPATQGKIEKAVGLHTGAIAQLASGDEGALRLVPTVEPERRQSPTLDEATELQLAIALLERIRTRVEKP